MSEDLEWVNVYALHWIQGSASLLLFAGVPPSSGYGRNMGKARGYIVDVPSGKIVRSMDGCELAKAWKSSIGGLDVCSD